MGEDVGLSLVQLHVLSASLMSGAVSHGRDYRRSAGGFIHGFRQGSRVNTTPMSRAKPPSAETDRPHFSDVWMRFFRQVHRTGTVSNPGGRLAKSLLFAGAA